MNPKPDELPGEIISLRRSTSTHHFTHHTALMKRTEVSESTWLSDGASRARTGDLLGAIQALSQLSYSPAVGEV